MRMGTITLNGKPHSIENRVALVELLNSIGVDRRLIAVAHNGEVIPRDRYEGVRLSEGDTVEVVRMVGGG